MALGKNLRILPFLSMSTSLNALLGADLLINSRHFRYYGRHGRWGTLVFGLWAETVNRADHIAYIVKRLRDAFRLLVAFYDGRFTCIHLSENLRDGSLIRYS